MSRVEYNKIQNMLFLYISNIYTMIRLSFQLPTLTARKFSPLSVARALAIIVLEQPGGPYMRIPRGGDIPILRKASGCWRGHSTACLNFSLTSSWPPMSVHRTCPIKSSFKIQQTKNCVLRYSRYIFGTEITGKKLLIFFQVSNYLVWRYNFSVNFKTEIKQVSEVFIYKLNTKKKNLRSFIHLKYIKIYNEPIFNLSCEIEC